MNGAELSLPSVGEGLLARIDDMVLHLTLDRPASGNALVRPVLDGLERLIRWAAIAPDVRALLLTAEGKHFCVGDDFAGLGDHEGVPSTEESECFDSYTRVVSSLVRLRKPIVVALHGAVYGAGMDIALACDLRVADDTTVIGASYSAHGFASGTTLLPMYVGVPTARRMLLLAEKVDTTRAVSIGLVDQVVPTGTDLGAASTLAHRLASGPTMAFGLVKSALLTGTGIGVLERLQVDEEISLLSVASGDGREGVRAFSERREPNFAGRWTLPDQRVETAAT